MKKTFVPYDEPVICDGEELILGDIIADEYASTPDDIRKKLITRKIIERLIAAIPDVMEQLTDKEKTIIIKYFGLNGEKKHTLEQVGALFKGRSAKRKGLSPESINKSKNKALMKLRKKIIKTLGISSKEIKKILSYGA